MFNEFGQYFNKIVKFTKHVSPRNKNPTKEYLDFASNFINFKTPENVYLLGFLWADGSVAKDRNRITFSINIDDGKALKNTFLSTGDWTISENYNVRKNENPLMIFRITNHLFREFLIDNDYISKSWFSACKILSKIPEHLQHYWWRGLIDGDGNIHQNCIRIHSGYNQDWTYIKTLSNKLNLTYRIDKVFTINKNKKHEGGSSINFIKKSSLIFGNYIYKDREKDKIGLDRKFNKFVEIFKPIFLEEPL